jgi:hypothetical protein
MTDTATAPPPAATEPDPDRAEAARLDPAAVGNILRLLRTLFAYGKNLVEALRQEDDPNVLPWYAFLTNILGTTDPADITTTIIYGLLRLAALHARLSPLLPLPLQAWAAEQTKAGGRRPRQVRGPTPRKPQAATGWAIPAGWPAGQDSLDREPTPEEDMLADILAEDQDRPIGPILLDICLDLGIVPALMDPATWDELRQAITLCGADPAPLEARAKDAADPPGLPGATDVGRKSEARSADGIAYPPWPAPQYPVPAATGPPSETDH